MKYARSCGGAISGTGAPLAVFAATCDFPAARASRIAFSAFPIEIPFCGAAGGGARPGDAAPLKFSAAMPRPRPLVTRGVHKNAPTGKNAQKGQTPVGAHFQCARSRAARKLWLRGRIGRLLPSVSQEGRVRNGRSRSFVTLGGRWRPQAVSFNAEAPTPRTFDLRKRRET